MTAHFSIIITKSRFLVQYFRLVVESSEQLFPQLLTNLNNLRKHSQNNCKCIDVISFDTTFLINGCFLIVCHLVFLLKIFSNFLYSQRKNWFLFRSIQTNKKTQLLTKKFRSNKWSQIKLFYFENKFNLIINSNIALWPKLSNIKSLLYNYIIFSVQIIFVEKFFISKLSFVLCLSVSKYSVQSLIIINKEVTNKIKWFTPHHSSNFY